MDSRLIISRGVFTATLLAGPIRTLFLGVATLVDRTLDLSDLGFFAVALIFSVPVGMAVSFLPNLFGTAILAYLGWSNEGMRLLQVWFTVGALAGGVIGAVMSDVPGDHGSSILWWAAMGATCALLCRRGVRGSRRTGLSYKRLFCHSGSAHVRSDVQAT